jgi:hypothetical protein
MNTKSRNLVVDFVARGEVPGEWRMVLVEEGPWPAPAVDGELRRLQTRIYDCVDAALDGQMADKFPESRGKRIVIQLDGYRLPANEVQSFFEHFSQGALCSSEYQAALNNNPFTQDIGFELNLSDGDSTGVGLSS